jgi:hypothetical protein
MESVLVAKLSVWVPAEDLFNLAQSPVQDNFDNKERQRSSDLTKVWNI